jgi:drug/metabolite transporter (DMT)-like permease
MRGSAARGFLLKGSWMTASPSQIVQLLVFSVCLSSGQILFKFAADGSQKITNLQGFVQLLANPFLWLAGVLYGGATLLWIVILQQVPLSRAYPFAALGFVLVPLCSYFLFGESISLRFTAGTAFILVGVYLAALAPT